MRVFFLVLAAGCLLVWGGRAAAEECDNPGSLNDVSKVEGCILKYRELSEAISKANANNLKELNNLKAQIANLKVQIAGMDKQLVKLGREIEEREVKMEVKQELLRAKIRQDYLRKREQMVLLTLFSSQTAAQLIKDWEYRERLAAQDRQVIGQVAEEVKKLSEQAAGLERQKISLANLKTRVNSQAEFLAREVEKASAYVADLGSKVAALSARQRSLLAERTGVFTTAVGEVPLADDPAARPDYNPGFSPAFAMFSFGAPHFKGMSQYGAFGRAKAGQSAEEILRAYYGQLELKKDYSTEINITVRGYGTVDLETYVKRIYEVPNSWGEQGGIEALKAQAVAARSYALAYTDNGRGSICATENCQVYKPVNKGGRWEEAVNATRGWVLMHGGKPFNAYYAASSGGHQMAYCYNGHCTPALWDTTSDWTKWAEGAWEVKAGSPWFYKGWYKSRSGKTCGRSHPWLNQTEMSDIVNAAIVVQAGGDTSGILPEDSGSCWGGSDNPWSKERLAQEADKHGGRVTAVTSVRVEHGSDGFTRSVILGTSRGQLTIGGANFQRAFNLRAPGALALKGKLFNVEMK